MAQFKLINDLNNVLRMDEPITRGPMPRWQKKGLEVSNTSINTSVNMSMNASTKQMKANTSVAVNASMSKTPTKTHSKTPSKTPKHSPGIKNSKSPTPGKGSRTPSGGDRFIPTRQGMDFDLAHYKLNQENDSNSPTMGENQRAMGESLHGKDIGKERILAYQTKAPAPPEGYQNPLKAIYTQTKTPASAKVTTRYIPQAPDRILDAPDIMDDYYLNLIDWSPNNTLAVALGNSVYLWNAGTGSIEELVELQQGDYVCSVQWLLDREHLAIGTSLGTIQLWDVKAMKRDRTLAAHDGRVGSLAWNNYILSSGSRRGQIVHSDVRIRDHLVATLHGHTQEVCGLKWSPDGRYLASGGNDNMLNIWAAEAGTMYTRAQPLYSINAHQAAVKALAWCPWQPQVLASGGGTADRCIKFWNCNTGTCLNTVDTRSQVCALQWSTNYKELVSGHGYANNQLIIWKYPTMKKVTELIGHSARVLHLAMSPDGSTVMSAGADETLRLWKCFVVDQAKKKTVAETKPINNILKTRIR